MKINCKVNIKTKRIISEMPQAWSKQDYVNILDELGYSEEISEEEIKEMTMMALSDQEPEESAEILLKYRLSEQLSKGQIQTLSHEMQEDKASEEYPDISIQHELFNINQLLFKSFNGRFPNCHAMEVNFNLMVKPNTIMTEDKWTNEIILKALLPALGDHSVISRLYGDELAKPKKFVEADSIIWKKNIQKQEDGSYTIQLFSSEYWLHDIPNNADYDTNFEIFIPTESPV
jgi:hypothetical protein